MAGDGDRNPRVGWRHEWGTLALLWAMVIWVSVTILGTRGAARSFVTLADAVVVAFVLAGGVLGTLTIVRAARIPMLSAPLPAGDRKALTEDTVEVGGEEPEVEELEVDQKALEEEAVEAELEAPEVDQKALEEEELGEGGTDPDAEAPEVDQKAEAKSEKPEVEAPEVDQKAEKPEKPENKPEKKPEKPEVEAPEVDQKAEKPEKAENKPEKKPEKAEKKAEQGDGPDGA